jgi:hypothetical protein
MQWIAHDFHYILESILEWFYRPISLASMSPTTKLLYSP